MVVPFFPSKARSIHPVAFKHQAQTCNQAYL